MFITHGFLLISKKKSETMGFRIFTYIYTNLLFKLPHLAIFVHSLGNKLGC